MKFATSLNLFPDKVIPPSLFADLNADDWANSYRDYQQRLIFRRLIHSSCVHQAV